MNLDDWLKNCGMTVSAFAKAVQVKSVNTVYRWLKGEQLPSPERAKKILEVTRGQVGFADIRRAYRKRRECEIPTCEDAPR